MRRGTRGWSDTSRRRHTAERWLASVRSSDIKMMRSSVWSSWLFLDVWCVVI